MQELEQMINIYHTGFLVCLVLTCVFLAASVFMFFKFDIRRIIDMKTGRGAKKKIQKMEEINARTGKLRQDMVSHTPSVLRPEDRIAYPATAPNLQVQAEASRMGAQMAEGSQETEVLSQENETEVLFQQSEAAVPSQENETTVLSQNMQSKTRQPKIKLPGVFQIEKEIMWIHTEEVL